MGGVRKSLGGVQLFASAWGVGLVGADRSKLERKKLCIIEKLLNYLKYIRVAKILAINSIFGVGGGKNFWGGVQNHSGGLIIFWGGVHPPRKSVPVLDKISFHKHFKSDFHRLDAI